MYSKTHLADSGTAPSEQVLEVLRVSVSQHHNSRNTELKVHCAEVVLETHTVKSFTHIPKLQTKSTKLQAHYLLYVQSAIVKQT